MKKRKKLKFGTKTTEMEDGSILASISYNGKKTEGFVASAVPLIYGKEVGIKATHEDKDYRKDILKQYDAMCAEGRKAIVSESGICRRACTTVGKKSRVIETRVTVPIKA